MADGWQFQTCGEITLIRVSSPRGFHAVFSTRTGGTSRGPYESLNLGFHVGDDPGCVAVNRARFFRAAGLDPGQVVAMQQVHGRNVHRALAGDARRGVLSVQTAVPDSDALVTGERGLGLVAFFADCVPVYLFSPRRQLIGLCHAGWKGTVLRVVGEAVAEMVRTGAGPGEIEAVIGPSICGRCYEVGEDVASQFMREFGKNTSALSRAPGGKWLLDLREANRQTLKESGVPEENISVVPLCTSCLSELFFSHRRDKHPTGRMAALCWIDTREE